jgi:phosphate transport system substrate-binding protein
MTDDQMASAKQGAVLVPATAGLIVLAYNLPGNPKGLKLPRDVYSNIFLGKITKWNDPQIVKANPGMKLPDLPITVVVRADSSGTNAVFTKHLSAINADFKKDLGEGNTVNWHQVFFSPPTEQEFPKIWIPPHKRGVGEYPRNACGGQGILSSSQ